MSGHLGSEKVTVQNLKIVSLDLENNLLLIQGSVPGATGSRVILRPSRNEDLEFPFQETQPEETQPEETQPQETQNEKQETKAEE